MTEQEKAIDFAIFIIYAISEKTSKFPNEIYASLNRADIIDGYIIPCYDVLHTLGKEYLVEDIVELAYERGEIL